MQTFMQKLPHWKYVNAGEYVVEDGTYQLYAAHSSDLKGENVLSKKVKVSGSTLSNADTAEKLNVWSRYESTFSRKLL